MRATAIAALLALAITGCSSSETPAPAPAASPTGDAYEQVASDIDQVQEDYGFYGSAPDKFFEAIAYQFIAQDCAELANIQSLWENPPNYMKETAKEAGEDGRLELIGAAIRAQELLGC